MTREELIKLCRYYQEGKTPPSILSEPDRAIWASEKACCDYFSENISDERSFLHFFASHLTKWNPYDGIQILEYYLKEADPDLADELLATYAN